MLSVQLLHRPTYIACHPAASTGSVTCGASVSGPANSSVPDTPSASYGTVCQWYFRCPDESAAAGVHCPMSERNTALEWSITHLKFELGPECSHGPNGCQQALSVTAAEQRPPD